MQRLCDILLSGLALLALSPLLILIALVLRFTGEREVLFLQARVGRGGKLFKVYKFATMLKNSPNIGTGTLTLRDDPRILPVGRILRRTKINELPQLLNVLTGDMSIIGPRPQTQRCFDAIPAGAREAILQVRPGLSGIGSIVFRDEEQMMHGHPDPDYFYDHVIMPYKGQLEEWYIRRPGPGTYFLLIWLSLWVVVVPKSRLVWRMFKSLPHPPATLAPYFDAVRDGE